MHPLIVLAVFSSGLSIVSESHAQACPPGTVYDPSIRRCVSVTTPPRPHPRPIPHPRPLPPDERRRPPQDNRPIVIRPPVSGDPDEISATNIVNQALSGLTCEQAGQSLRRLSNQVLALAASANRPEIPGRPTPDFKRQWQLRIRSPQFWKRVWLRMADAYQSCNRPCFEDGLAVGEISATAYCATSIAVQGLPGPGFLAQTPLPVCESAIHQGCLVGYERTANQYQGCELYSSNSSYGGIFAEYQSQDCHL